MANPVSGYGRLLEAFKTFADGLDKSASALFSGIKGVPGQAGGAAAAGGGLLVAIGSGIARVVAAPVSMVGKFGQKYPNAGAFLLLTGAVAAVVSVVNKVRSGARRQAALQQAMQMQSPAQPMAGTAPGAMFETPEADNRASTQWQDYTAAREAASQQQNGAAR